MFSIQRFLVLSRFFAGAAIIGIAAYAITISALGLESSAIGEVLSGAALGISGVIAKALHIV